MTSEVTASSPLRVAVGDLTLDAGTHRVTVDGRDIMLPKLSFQLLMALIRAAPDMLSVDQLMDIVWSGRVVSNETVSQRVKLLRQALGDDANSPKYIGVVRGEGYRLLVDVRPLPQPPPSASRPASPASARRAAVGLAVLGVALALTLGWWVVNRGESSAVAQPRLAVLPFLNLSTETSKEPFVDGLTEEIITELSRIPDLRVAGRTASFSFKGLTPSFAEVGRALDVDHVLEGSVRWEGDSLLVAAQLISVASGFHLWSETYERDLAGVFSIQQDIAREVSRSLRLELGVADMPDIGTENGLAYAHFLRGQALFWNHTPELTAQSVDALRAALELDPKFVRAWIGLGYAYGAVSRDPARTSAALEDMRRAAQQAMTLAPQYWEVHALQAWVLMSHHAFLEGERTMERALLLRGQARRTAGNGYCSVTCYFQQVGRVSDAVTEARWAQEFDPLSPSADVWSKLYLLGRREEAIAAYRELESMHVTPESKRSFELWMDLENPDPAVMNKRFANTPLAGMWGHPEQLSAAIAPLTNTEIPVGRGTRATFAMYAALHGNGELAVRLLRAEFLPPGFGAYFLMWHPALAKVRSTQAFVDLVTELGLVNTWRETGQWGDYCHATEGGGVSCR